jgi:hypothetical protein
MRAGGRSACFSAWEEERGEGERADREGGGERARKGLRRLCWCYAALGKGPCMGGAGFWIDGFVVCAGGGRAEKKGSSAMAAAV